MESSCKTNNVHARQIHAAGVVILGDLTIGDQNEYDDSQSNLLV
jgi:hypothetical protein